MLSEKLVIAEARVEQLGHEIKRADEVVVGKNALLQELQALQLYLTRMTHMTRITRITMCVCHMASSGGRHA